MATKSTKKSAPNKEKESAAREKAKAVSQVTLRPSLNAAAVIESYASSIGEQDIQALMDSLTESMEKVWDGDLRRCEAMLLGQAHALQAIFMNLSRRAVKQEYLKNYETFLRLGLKAQSQCRATLETLAAIKNPPVAIVRQANIAHGPQQINNGATPTSTHVSAQAHAGENQKPQTQLLESQHGEWMDTGAAGATGRNDPEMATVGAIDRPENSGG